MEKEIIISGECRFQNPSLVPPREWSNSTSKWPNITKEKIKKYFLDSIASDNQPANARKSLESGNYFESGWVGPIFTLTLDNIYVACRGEVARSQTLSETDHKAWFVSTTNGDVVYGHCSCTAGLARVCSHIGALLFKIEFFKNEETKGPACTSLPNEWNDTTRRKIEPEKFVNIPFFKNGSFIKEKIPPVRRSVHYENHESFCAKFRNSPLASLVFSPGSIISNTLNAKILAPSPPSSPRNNVLGDNTNFQNILCKDINHTIHFGDCDIPLNSTSVKCQHCKNFFEKYVEMDKEKKTVLEKETVSQSESFLWKDCRAIRITASTAKNIPKRNTTKLENFLKNHVFSKFRGNKATKHGTALEPVARNVYQDTYGVEITLAGTVISKDDPWLSASPDGYIGSNEIIEIKCPMTNELDKLIDSNKYDVKKTKEGEYFLDHSGKNSYYLQVQIQLYCTKRSTCHFFVFTMTGNVRVIVNYNETFMLQHLKRMRTIYISHMLPYLVDLFTQRKLHLHSLKKFLSIQSGKSS